MAKKTKTLADVQTVTTVNDDQLIPITDASGNVVKVSMANLRAALIGNLIPATRNLALNSGGELPFNSGRWDMLYLKLEEQPALGAEYTLSWDDLQWEGSENKIIIRLWAGSYTGAVNIISTAEKGSGSKTITIPDTFRPDLTYQLLFGFNSAGNTGFVKNVMWAKGNVRVPWAPSINDLKQNAIDGVKVGGVNMLDGSETMKSWSIQHASRQSYQGYDCAVATGDVHSQCGVYLYKDKMPTLEVGKEYVSSVWVFAEQVSTLQIGLEANSIGFYYRLSEDEVGKWIRVSLLQKSTDPSTSFVCYADIKDPSHKVAFRMAQLEEGNKETTWSRSYNDLKAQFAPAVLSSESE